MPRIPSSDVVVPATLPADARRELTDALYAVHGQVFAGVERDAFAR
jgi:hypothetical protein